MTIILSVVLIGVSSVADAVPVGPRCKGGPVSGNLLNICNELTRHSLLCAYFIAYFFLCCTKKKVTTKESAFWFSCSAEPTRAIRCYCGVAWLLQAGCTLWLCYIPAISVVTFTLTQECSLACGQRSCACVAHQPHMAASIIRGDGYVDIQAYFKIGIVLANINKNLTYETPVFYHFSLYLLLNNIFSN